MRWLQIYELFIIIGNHSLNPMTTPFTLLLQEKAPMSSLAQIHEDKKNDSTLHGQRLSKTKIWVFITKLVF